jgi:hypothetical protein
MKKLSSNLLLTRRCGRTSTTRAPRCTFQELQKYIKYYPSPIPQLNLSEFRLVKKPARVKSTLPFSFAVRDGFEGPELKPLPKMASQRHPRRTQPRVRAQKLTLVNTREVDQLPSSLPTVGDFETVSLETSSNVDLCNSELPSALKRSRKEFFDDEVYTQLMSLTAPGRSESGSIDEHGSDLETESNVSEQVDDHDSRPSSLSHQELLQVQPQEIEDNVEDYGPPSHRGGQFNKRGIEKDETLFDADEPVRCRSEEYLTRPGQVVRMKPSGQWVEVHEMIVDMDTRHNSVTPLQQEVIPRSRPLRSILKSI